MSADALRRAKRRRRYAEVPEALLFNPEISSHAKTAWGILDRHIDNRVESLGTETEGVAFPSRQTLADYMGVGLDTVDRALAQLRLAGWLTTTRRGQGRTALNELHDEPEAAQVRRQETAQVRRQETAQVRRQETAQVRRPKKNGPKDNEHEGTFSDENAEKSAKTDHAPPSSRSSSDTDVSADEQPAGLTPCPEPHVAAAAPSINKQRPKAGDQKRRDADYRRRANAEAVALADRLFTEVRPALAENAQVLELTVGRMLANGFTAAQIEAAVRHPDCASWSYNALVFLIRKPAPKAVGPDGFPLKARPGPPPPPVIVAQPKVKIGAERLAEIKARNDQVRAARKAEADARRVSS